MSTATISASDVNKLRQMTGAGMMDCKKALMEANGDFEKAIDELRKKGQKVAANRADREAKEGYIVAKTNADATKGYLVAISCETDFVAKNADFVKFAEDVLNLAITNNTTSKDALLSLPMEGVTVNDKVIDMVGKIGEKIEITSYEVIEAPKVVIYIHPGNKVVSMVGMSSATAPAEAGKDVAMQIAAMNPVAIDKDDVDQKTLDREIEIGKEQARAEGKPENMIEKIAMGKLNKFYQESTLLNQSFIKEDKKTIRQYLDGVEKGLTVKAFRRVQIG
ncbi:MAG: Elongation factor Ts [Bacteroidetes bacterium ADurb.Bin141]|nr:Elongation factor Ts [Bacteroidia bacterium]MCB0848162.1 elongation factor Ts [Bacteroidota bacterium]MCE7955289.1 elongation factor Ts [Bacteroidetes bacterium CHB6]OQB63551.1 MAG: Elongation factor Ts [Bacteroidetes bacterium ADurb.Bin141]MCO5289905.1 translation elongation factor Ts [Bacteroidota bacterium]